MKWTLVFLLWATLSTPVEAVTSHSLTKFETGGAYTIEVLDINDRGNAVGSRRLEQGQFASVWDDKGRLIGSITGIPGEVSSKALSINNEGQVLMTSRTLNNPDHLILKNPDGSIVDFGAGISDAHLNNSGQVVGTWWEDNRKMFFWDPSAGFTYLGSGVTGGINDNGQVIGMSTEENTWKQSFIWSKPTGSLMIGNRPAYGVNDSGMIVGIGEYWTQASGWQKINLPPGVSSAYMTDINSQGLSVGTSSSSIPYARKAFTWSLSLGFKELLLPVGAVSSSASGISDSGQILGTIDNVPYLWTPVPEPSSLMALVIALLGLTLFTTRRKK